jgi:phosphoglycerate dehydrogenase-like enzyme
MNPSLFVSRQLVSDFKEKLTGILARAPRKLDVLEFTPDVKLTPEQHASIEATFYSRDIWEGTIKTRLSDAAMVYWPIVDSAPNLKWLQVVSAGSDQKPYQPSIKRGLRVATSAGANAGPVGLTR